MLRVRLLGPMRVEWDGVPVEAPPSRRAWALLAWLALHPGAHARSELAACFWPDVLDSSARASLRSAVWALRRALGAAERSLRTTGHDIALAEEPGLWVNAREFEALRKAGRLEEAVELGDGDLLAGFDDEWALQARDEHRERLAEALEHLAVSAEEANDLEAAVRLTRRQASLDPLDEQAHRRLMRRLAAIGDRGGALATYERLRERLRRELRVAPAHPTRELADELHHERAPPSALRASPRSPPGQLPLVGRERELGQLLDAWTAARAGGGSVVTLSGEPGIGKTRLGLELLARAGADGARTATCAAFDLGGAAALGLWAELIHGLAEGLEAPPLDAAWPADLAPLAPDLERRFGRERTSRPAASPDLERARLHEGVVELITWASRGGPIALLMEDVHVADAASLELVRYLGRRAAQLPVLVVLTRRPHPRRSDVDVLEHALRAQGVLLVELALGPLAPEAVARLAREVAPLARGQLAQVVAAADGNALLAVEWSRALARGEREPPASLRGAVRAALAPLSPEPRLVAEFAAAAGRELTRAEAAALPIASPAEAATGALDTGILVARGGCIGYRHALLREAAYLDLPDPHRAWLHQHLASALGTADDRAAEVARHLRLAGQNDGAVAELVRAAAHARAVAALTEAAGFLAEAIELAPRNGRLLVELAEVEAWRGRIEASESAFVRAIELLEGSDEALAEAWLRRAGWWRGALCAPRQVAEASRRALDLLEQAGLASPRLRREALASCAWSEAAAGDAAVADELLARAEQLMDPEETDDLLVHWIENARALALIRRGRFAESYEPSLASGEAAIRAGRPDLSYESFAFAACAAACAGDFELSLELVDRGMAVLRGTGLIALEVQYLAARSYVLTRVGCLDEALASSRAEAGLAERLDRPDLRATAEHDRGMVAFALGDFARAEALLARALEHDAPVSRPLARLTRAEALVRLDRWKEAEEEVHATALEPIGPSDFPDTLVPRLTRIQGLIAAGRGDQALAAQRLREAAEGWRRRLDRSRDGERYAASLTDLGRPPVAGLVEPDRELERVLADLRALGEGE